MSYILDALKKSERLRHLGKAPVYGDAGAGTSPAFFRWASIAAGLLLVAALLLALLLPLRRAPLPTAAPETPVAPAVTASAPPAPAEAPPAPAVAPSSAAPARLEQSVVKPEKPARAVRPAAVAPPPSAARGEAPWLVSLPEAFRRSLPPLAVNIHVYAPDEAQRILYINNRPVRRGEQVEDGVVVEDIVPEGVVLQYRGQRFKLPRPS